MAEINPGAPQGEILPIYLAIRDISGQLVGQPENSPTIEIIYIDEDSKVRTNSIQRTKMDEIEPGRYFYLWHIDKNEPTVVHDLLLRGVIDDEGLTATDITYQNTNLIRNPTFVVKVNIIEQKTLCYPEVMPYVPHCNGERRCLCNSHHDEIDIGLDDRQIEGAFRFGEFPNQVVDRRVAGAFTVQLGRGYYTWVRSSDPGGGSAQRPQEPPMRNMRYRNRYRY